jgi:hypothetical protein
VQDQPAPVQDQPSQAPAGCTPRAPNNISASAGHVSGSSNGNGGSWTVSGAPVGTVTISDSGMVACPDGLHHTLNAVTNTTANDCIGPGNSKVHCASSTCNPTMGSSVSGTVTTYLPSDTISVRVTYDQGC